MIAVVDHGQVIAEGTPAELKADLGATVLDLGFDDPDRAAEAAAMLAASRRRRCGSRAPPSS